MKKEILSLIALIIGAIFFNTAFWEKEIGLNSMILAIIIVGFTYFFHKEAFASRAVQLSSLGVLLSAKMVFWNHSDLSQVIHNLTLMVHGGLICAPNIRFLGTAFALFFAQFLTAPIKIIQHILNIPNYFGASKMASQFKTLILSALIVPIFFIIYYQTNSDLKWFSDKIGVYLSKIFTFDISFGRFMFFCFSLTFIAAYIFKNKIQLIPNLDNQLKLELERTNIEESDENVKTEFSSSWTLLILLNMLLLINNVLDVKNVWLKMGELTKSADLKEFVHSGTYILIFGILLAMCVLFYVFKGNLNFITNKNLEKLAFLWLGQNLFCVFSVAVRNIQYINQCGLAYKRIGVFIFLLLVCIGLGLMYRKIKEKRTAFDVIFKGAWAIYLVLVLATCVNWDGFITKFNIENADTHNYFDDEFLVREVSDKNLPYLLENEAKIKELAAKHPRETEFNYETSLEKKLNRFKRRNNSQTFWEWNYADYKTYNYLKKVGKI